MNNKPSEGLQLALHLMSELNLPARQAAIRAGIAISTLYRSRQYRVLCGLPERATQGKTKVLPVLKQSTWVAPDE